MYSGSRSGQTPGECSKLDRPLAPKPQGPQTTGPQTTGPEPLGPRGHCTRRLIADASSA